MLSKFSFLTALAALGSCIMVAQSPAPARSTAEKSALEQGAAAAPKKIAVPAIPYEKYKLSNGLEVILYEDHRLPLVAVNLWYDVGPANERPGRTGFAHLFEHLMFEGSKHVEEKTYFKHLEAAGGSDINGNTDMDRTVYFETVPSNELEKALWLESDRMGFLLDTLDGAKLANQRDVVRNERRQTTENEPYGLADEALFHGLFPKGHPYYAHVIGSHADIEAARLADVREFFRLYYAPNNASLAIAGDIDKARVKALVEKYFGPIPAGSPVPKVEVKTPPVLAERRLVITDQVKLPRVYIAWITDPIYGPDDAGEQLLGQILGIGKSSRLYKRLVYEKQMAQDVYAEQYSLTLGSIFFIQVTARPGIQPEQLEAAIDEELAALRESGPTQSELEGARNVFETNIIRSLERLGAGAGVASRLNQYNHYLGDPGFLPKDIDRYERVTTGALRSIARQKLGKNSRVVIYAVPGEKVIEDVPKTAKQEEGTAQAKKEEDGQAWRSQPPAPGPAPIFSLPVPKRFKLSNGLSVLLMEKHNLPVVSANLVVLRGSDANPLDKPGLAAFTAAMLAEGTKKRSALQIAADADRLGAGIGTRSTSDWSGVFITCLKQNMDPAFDLLSDVALNPAFAPQDVERIRKERLASLLQERDNARTLAMNIFYRAVYGEKHPYGYTELGTGDSLKKIEPQDLANFWANGYVPSNAALVIAGDITGTEGRSLAEKYFGSWKGGAASASSGSPPFKEAVLRKIVIVDKPGAPQTSLLVGGLGVARSNPDYVPVEVMNTMLGGLFSARLNMNLREKHGYAYGANSHFLYRRAAGPFYARADVRTEVTAPAIREFLSELNGIRTNPLSADELKMSRDSMARSLPGLFETAQQTARSIGDLFVYSLPLDSYGALPSQIEAVNSAEAQRAAERYIHPDSMIIVAVGDRARIEPEIAKLNLGPIEIRDAEGNLQGPRPQDGP